MSNEKREKVKQNKRSYWIGGISMVIFLVGVIYILIYIKEIQKYTHSVELTTRWWVFFSLLLLFTLMVILAIVLGAITVKKVKWLGIISLVLNILLFIGYCQMIFITYVIDIAD